MKKKIFKQILIYALLLVCQILLRTLSFGSALSYGLFLGALYCINPWWSSLVFLLSALPFGWNTLLVSATQCAVVLVAVLIHGKCNMKIRKGLLILYILGSQAFYVAYRLDVSQDLFIRLLNVAISVAFSFVCVYVVRALFVRGLRYRLGVDEQICLAVLVTALVAAIAPFELFGVSVVKIITPFCILFSLFTLGGLPAFCVASVFGLGCSIAYGSLLYTGIFCFYTLTAVAFSPLSRYLSTLAITLSELVTVYFFKAYEPFGALTLLPVVIGCAFFCIVPSKTLQFVSDLMGYSKTQYSSRNIINRVRVNLSRKLYQLSDIFYQMQLTFKSMVKGVLSPDKAVDAIARETCDKVCVDCAERTKCWRLNPNDTQAEFAEITMSAMDRGKATLLDINSGLVNRCLRINTVLSTINSEVATYKQYYVSNSSSDNSRLLIGEQLKGVSQIMLQLSNDCKGTIVYDREKEKQILEELTFCNVLAKEVVIWEEANSLSVTLTVALSDAKKDILLSIVSKAVKSEMMIESMENVAEDSNWVVLHLCQKPAFDVTFGLSQVVKAGSELSGDTHTFIKIGKSKFLLALCDGMGSGLPAERTSNIAISLVENFYKAGFDNDIILGSVNKLLTITSEENFTAVDICVLNLNKGLTDFIKIGSPSSLVRCGNTVQFISGGSLPLGVLEEMKPIMTKKALSSGDIIMLYSDGFYDAFPDKNVIAEMLDGVKLSNPQLIADEFMKKALISANNVARDDMTVIVAIVA